MKVNRWDTSLLDVFQGFVIYNSYKYCTYKCYLNI